MSDRMRVAVITHYYPTSADPAAGQSAYQTLKLLAQSCDVHVFVPEMTYPRLFTPPGGRREPLDRTWKMPGPDVTYVPYPIFPVISRPLNGTAIAWRVAPHVRAYRPDIILSYVVYSNGYAAVKVGEQLHVPVVLVAIGSDLNRIPDALCRSLTKSALRRANHVITVSHDLQRTAIGLGADPQHTCTELNGCDTQIFHPADQAEARIELGLNSAAEIVLFVGRWDLRKGLLELVQAVAALRSQRPMLQCYIVGDGPDQAAVIAMITKLNAESFILIRPSMASRDVARWMAAADLVTLPSYNEGCPNVVVEALSAGRPVVATSVGGIPELMDESVGRLVPPRQVEPLGIALADVLDREWDAGQIAATHRKSWMDVARGMYQVLETTLRDHRSAMTRGAD